MEFVSFCVEKNIIFDHLQGCFSVLIWMVGLVAWSKVTSPHCQDMWSTGRGVFMHVTMCVYRFVCMYWTPEEGSVQDVGVVIDCLAEYCWRGCSFLTMSIQTDLNLTDETEYTHSHTFTHSCAHSHMVNNSHKPSQSNQSTSAAYCCVQWTK